MTISLSKPAEGSVGWAAAVNQNWTDIETEINSGSGGGYPKRYIEGLVLTYLSATTARVTPGSCRNQANTGNLTLTSNTTADITTAHGAGDGLAQLNGLDEKGLDNLSSNPITCSKSGTTITASADITSHLGTRALSGTFSTSSTSVTGSGTAFLSEVSIGDLIGTSSTYGWSRVTAVSSDTSLTLVAALPGGNAPGGTSGTVIHNPTIRPDSAGAKDRISTINAAGTSIVVPTSGSSSAGAALTIGVEVNGLWLAVWVVNDGSSTGVLLSTQHETLLTQTGGTSKFTSARRVGWIRNDGSSGNLHATFYTDGVGVRVATLELDTTDGGAGVVLSAGNATAWTGVNCNSHCPRTCYRAWGSVRVLADSTNGIAQFRGRSRGPSTIDRSRVARHSLSAASEEEQTIVEFPLDGAQCFDYAMTVSTADAYVYLYSFEDTL